VINAAGGMGYTWSRIGGKKAAEKGPEKPKAVASEKGSSGGGAKVNAAARKKKQ